MPRRQLAAPEDETPTAEELADTARFAAQLEAIELSLAERGELPPRAPGYAKLAARDRERRISRAHPRAGLDLSARWGGRSPVGLDGGQGRPPDG